MIVNKNHLITLGLFLFSWAVYTATTAQYKPFYSYHHELYQAQAFLHGRFDVSDLPNYYHDVTVQNGKTYLPFGPTPALLLLPFVALFGNSINPQYVGAFIGAFNVVLVYFLLKKVNKSLTTNYLLLTTLFFAFGTMHWYTVYIGSTWYFIQVVGTFSVLLAMNFALLSYPPFFSIGLLIGLAVLARPTLSMSLPFFLLLMFKTPFKTSLETVFGKLWRLLRHPAAAGNFLLPYCLLFFGLLIPFTFLGWYNFIRFGSVFENGYELLYHHYINFPVPVTIFQYYNRAFPLFGFLDIRNIPIHIYTAFLLPPVFKNTFPYLEFLPFGTSILFTSPLLLLIPYAGFKKRINKIALLTGIMIMFAVFLNFMQGWVQFSYRYLLDFLPFFLIPLSYAIERINKKIVLILLIISISMNALGIIYGAQ